MKTGARKTILKGGSNGRYLPTGHLVYALGGVLYALPFDAGHLETSGGPVGIVEGVARGNIAAHYAFSNSGTLVYVAGPVTGTGGGQDRLALVDHKGEIEPLKVPPPAAYGYPRVSRDGKHVAYQIDDGKEASIWIYDLNTTNAPRRLTLAGTGANRYPIWSADGMHVAFQSDREGDQAIWWQSADGSAPAVRLTKPEKGRGDIPDSWSPDGQRFSYSSGGGGTAAVWTYSLQEKKATLFAEVPGSYAARSVFSPDGRWVAYQASDPKGTEIFMKPYPPTATTYQISKDGNDHHPVWSPDQKELFYVPGGGRLVSVSVTTKPSVSFGSPVLAPRSGFITEGSGSVRTYDILPDGQHFIGVVSGARADIGSGAGSAPQFQVVLNWFEEVTQRLPRR